MTAPPEVRVFVGISLDGFIAGDGGDLSWLDVCAGESTAATGYDALLATADTLLMGRRTWEAIRGFEPWPYPGKRVAVATHRPLQARHGEQAVSGPVPEMLATLAAQGARVVYLDGGALVSQALDAGCVSELTLSIVPVVLGRGIRLFQGERGRSDWRLVATRDFPSGLVQCRYVPAGPPRPPREEPCPA